MKSLFSLASVFALSILATACNPETDPGMTDPAPAIGTVTVKVVTDNVPAKPIAGVPVSLNDESGAIVASGLTNASGEFAAEDIVSGGSVSVAYNDLGIGASLLETIFNAAPDKTYTFVFTGTDDHVATGTLTVSGAPAGTTSYDIRVGNCRPSTHYPPFAAFDITERCVQSDGKVSMMIYAQDSSWDILGYALLTDVTIPPSGIVNLNVSSWESYTSSSEWLRIDASFAGSPDPMTSAYPTLNLQRKGVLYRFEADEDITPATELTETAYKNVHFKTPNDLAFSENGKGYVLRLGAAIQGDYSRESGFISQSSSIFGSIQRDLSKWFLPQSLLDGVSADISDLVRPSVLWNTPELVEGQPSPADAALTVLTWKKPTDDSAVGWLGFAPIDYGFVQLPALPASMSMYLPPSNGAVFGGPAVYFLDQTNRAGFLEAATHENVNSLLREQSLEGSTNVDLRYIGSAAKNQISSPSSAPKRSSKRKSAVLDRAPRLIREAF